MNHGIIRILTDLIVSSGYLPGVLRDALSSAVLRKALSCGLGHPWGCSPYGLPWVSGVIPPTMVILTMLPRYTQGIICSTMSLCDVMGPIHWQGVLEPTHCIECFAITTVLQAITNVHVSFLCLPGQTSGTTTIFVIIDGWAITITSVGDSLCIFDAQGGDVSLLTMDHKLEENVEEWVLITFWFVLYYFAK